MLSEIGRLKMSFYFQGYARRRSSARELLWKATLNTGIILSGLTTLPSSTRSSSSSLSVELSAWAVGILETVDRLCRFCLLFWLYVKHNNVIRAVRILNVRLNIPWVQPVIEINSTFIDISYTYWTFHCMDMKVLPKNHLDGQPRSQGSLLPAILSLRRAGRREPWERGC